VGDVIEVREKSRKVERIAEALAKVDRVPMPAWIDLDRDAYKGEIKALPTRSDISAEIDEQLIVELYSK
jgi:small subunit ribosomal protein S4